MIVLGVFFEVEKGQKVFGGKVQSHIHRKEALRRWRRKKRSKDCQAVFFLDLPLLQVLDPVT